MTTPRNLLALGLAAIVVIAAALWLSNRRPSSLPEEIDAPLYSELRKEVNSVDAVRIFAAGDERAVELQRSPSGWIVTEASGYRADEAKVRELLLGMVQAELLEEKTANPENYPALGVEDVSAQEATGVRVELGGTQQPFNLIVGKHGPTAQSTYVRRAGEATSWLIDTSLDAPSAPQDWLDRDIVDWSADRIQSAAISIRGGKRYEAAKASRDDSNFEIAKLPKGKALSSPSAANGLGTALLGLTLTDVQPAEAFDAGPPDAEATFKTFDGLVAELDGWTKDDKHYIAMGVSFDEALAERFRTDSSSEDDTPSASGGEDAEATAGSEAGSTPEASEPATENALEKTKSEAQTLDAKVDAWIYEIPQYKYEAIFKPLEDLLEKS